MVMDLEIINTRGLPFIHDSHFQTFEDIQDNRLYCDKLLLPHLSTSEFWIKCEGILNQVNSSYKAHMRISGLNMSVVLNETSFTT